MANSTEAMTNSPDLLRYVPARLQGGDDTATWGAAGDPGQDDNDDEDEEEEDDFDDDDEGEDEDEEGDEESDEEAG